MPVEKRRGVPGLWRDEDVSLASTFPLGVRFGGGLEAEHGHTFTELVVVTHGSGVHRTRNGTYPLFVGDAFVIPEGESHAYPDADDFDIINVLFHPEILEGSERFLRRIPGYSALFQFEPRFRDEHGFESRLRLPPSELVTVEGLLMDLQQETTGRREGYEAVALGLFLRVIGILCRCFSQAPQPKARQLLRVGRVVSHLHQHFRRQVTLEELFEHAHMSRRTLLRQFKAATGVTPIEYLLRLRMATARRLLIQSDLNMAEISGTVGFKDSNYFARQFRHRFGESPSGFRKRHRRAAMEFPA